MSTSQQIHKALMRLHALKGRVAAFEAAPLTFQRTFPRFPTVSASFESPNLVAQDPTWMNYEHDFYACALRYSVWAHASNTMWRMTDNGAGLTLDRANASASSGFEGTSAPMFDFQWNMRRVRSKRWYGVANGLQQGDYGGLLSRDELGIPQRDEPLRFEHPWPILKGDGVIVRIQPTRFNTANFVSDSYSITRFTVHLTFDGFWGYA